MDEPQETEDLRLFPLPPEKPESMPIADRAPIGRKRPTPPRGEYPYDHPRVWTTSKATFISHYCQFFLFVTKHGNYIDGFAGPQDPEMLDSWAAHLVLEMEPQWMRKFFLFDNDPQKYTMLERLKATHEDGKREIHISGEDFNLAVDKILRPTIIKPTEATFCLIDQHSFECWWETLVKLSAYKTPKIELFYFVCEGWMDRGIAGSTTQEGQDRVECWWGRKDWPKLREVQGLARAMIFCERFQKELGYGYVAPFPIYESPKSSRVLYYMIHASDHPEAPKLMKRAYRKIEPEREKWFAPEFDFEARRGPRVVDRSLLDTGPTFDHLGLDLPPSE